MPEAPASQESILEEAQEIIHGARNASYGHPRDNFQNIANLWNAYLGTSISTVDVANLMILMKVARLNGNGYHRDSVVDIAGYAGTIERLQEPVDPASQPVDWDATFGERGPRQWDSLYYVPFSVRVRDNDGDLWEHHEDRGWRWSVRGRGDVWHEVDNLRTFDVSAPFTEVLDG